MKKRISIKQTDPAAYKAMYALEDYLKASKLDPIHAELIRIRASQINGCSYCLDMHSKDARKNGETEQRIYLLPAWREAPFFTDEERAILALTEEITLITGRVSDKTYEEAFNLLGAEYLSKVIMTIIIINAWNRIGVATEMQPPLSNVV